MYKRHIVGRIGERAAISLLENKGYKIISKNLRTPFSEVDLVAIKDDTLVFIEVKTRISKRFGSSLEAITPLKLQRLKKAIYYFSKSNPNLPRKLRIDVVAIDKTASGINSRIVPVY